MSPLLRRRDGLDTPEALQWSIAILDRLIEHGPGRYFDLPHDVEQAKRRRAKLARRLSRMEARS